MKKARGITNVLPDPFPPPLPVRLIRNVAATLATGGILWALSSFLDLVLPSDLPPSTEGATLFSGIALVAVAAVLYLVAEFLNGGEPTSVQSNRDKEARQIADRALAGKTTIPYALYLRPFDSTGQLRKRVRQSILLPQEPAIGGVPRNYSFELESLLSQVIWRWAPMISLGKPGEHFGSGRLPVDDKDWQEIAARLMREADSLFVLPGVSEGMMWELHHLRSTRHLAKTVMLMPPASDTSISFDTWEKVRAALVPLGYHLPEYNKRGAFFRLTDEGQIQRLAFFPKRWSLRGFRRVLEQFRE